MGSILHRRRNRRRILFACFALAVAACVWALLAELPPSLSRGTHETGVSLYLEITPTVATDADGLLAELGDRLDFAGSYDSIASEALQRARAAEFHDAETERSILELTPRSLVLVRGSMRLDSKLVLASDVSSFRPAPEAEPLPEGCLFRAEVGAAAAAWPREPGYTPHSEILLGQSSVTWTSSVRGAHIVAEELANVLAERAARVLLERATERGLKASLEPLR